MITIDRGGINIDIRDRVSFFFFFFKKEIEHSHHGEMTPLGFAVRHWLLHLFTTAAACYRSIVFFCSISLPLPGSPMNSACSKKGALRASKFTLPPPFRFRGDESCNVNRLLPLDDD